MSAPDGLQFGDWHALASQGQALDPYLIWALFSTRHTTLHAGPEEGDEGQPMSTRRRDVMHFIAEVVPGARISSLPEGAAVAQAYVDRDGDSFRHRFVTVRLDCTGLDPNDRVRRVYALCTCGVFSRLQLSTYTVRADNDAAMHVAGVAAVNAATPAQRATTGTTARVVLGVLEDGCPFAHQALCRENETRVLALWDQSSLRPADETWLPSPFLYGAHLAQADMNRFIARHLTPEGVDEEGLYRAQDVYMRRLARRGSHGAAVTGRLAGHAAWPAGPARPFQANEVLEDHPSHLPAATADAASHMPVVAVQMPRDLVKLTSGRWLAVCALDGLHYMVQKTQEHAGADAHLVANVSYGGQAGAHDGTGLLEQAMDELIAKSDGRLHIMLAAGNSYGTRRDPDSPDPATRLPSGVHGHCQIIPGQAAIMELFVPPEKRVETYLEVWIRRVEPDAPDARGAPLLDETIGITVISPTGERATLGMPDVAIFRHGGTHNVGAAIALRHASQSSRASLVMLALAPTQIDGSMGAAAAGRWTMEVTLQSGNAACRVDAWVERDDTFLARRRQGARLLRSEVAGALPQPHRGLTDEDTMSSIATGVSTRSVGALVNRPGPGPGVDDAYPATSPYSSSGGSLTRGPDYSAVADDGHVLSGTKVHDGLSGRTFRANGTSLAAPVVARAVANHLARQGVLATPAYPQVSPRKGFVVT